MTSFDHSKPAPKPSAAAPVGEGASGASAKGNWIHAEAGMHTHSSIRNQKSHLAGKDAAKAETEQVRAASAEEATAETDREEASRRFADAAIPASEASFGGKVKDSKVKELLFSDLFEYMGSPDTRHSKGFPNKTEA